LIIFAAMFSENLSTNAIRDLYLTHPQASRLIEILHNGSPSKVHVRGLSGSSASLLAVAVSGKAKGIHFFMLADKEEAAYFYNDLINTGAEQVHFYPSSLRRIIHNESKDPAQLILRTEVLHAIDQWQHQGAMRIVTYPEALAERIVSREKLQKNTFIIAKGNQLSIDFLDEVLREFHFERTDFVYEPGQYAVRGGIVDVFSFSSDFPYRIDFMGDEVDSIRSFDIESQLSTDQHDQIELVPDINLLAEGDVTHLLPEYAGSEAFLWSDDLALAMEKINGFQSSNEPPLDGTSSEECLLDAPGFRDLLERLPVVEFGLQPYFSATPVIEFRTSPQPVFRKNFELLSSQLVSNEKEQYQNILLAENQAQADRLNEIVHNLNPQLKFTILVLSLHGGFTDHDLKICLYTDHQIFDRYHKFKIRGLFRKSEQISLQELAALKPGDYVVHIDHGIGKFAGLQKIEVNGKYQEALRLVYKDNDILFVNINSLHKISKYKGKDGTEPVLHKLGSGVWQRAKQNTKKKVKDIARELIALYAKRKTQPGFAFSPDSYMQKELEASFIYEDTPDQLAATNAVKAGMEEPHPMEMLVCGDVGFGKTEVAIRAAFKAVADNKQVAVLVPTTILALQHYKTFSERLKNFPCTVDYLNRFRKPADQKKIIQRLASGQLDIIIGTHKLVGKEVHFKDLGLLVIDEEQKFGVAVKEKLKRLKLNVDTITLTATPIPRTLQFSLMGARDLAIINSPPPNRFPVLTEVHTFNEFIIGEAINYEVSRGGQIFFVHNRIQNIYQIQQLIAKVCPRVKTVVAHGQMDGAQLEKIMMDFISGDYDVLISTSIIESGTDIPNANTIIVNNAQQFGLSDLHQLRGRVGRSNRKAFCYLLAPPLSGLNQESRRRLKAIEENSELGSGFNISMQDLDIRGAGNLLGAEQSGFITEIGFETYQRILSEAMQELHDEEFSDLFREEEAKKTENSRGFPGKHYVSDCQIDTDMELHFPEDYVSNPAERIRLYRELDNMKDEPSLRLFEQQITDRFGKLPEASTGLLNVVRLRWKAEALGFEKVILRDQKMLLNFVSNQLSPYYNSDTFKKVLLFVQKNPDRIKMKESKEKLSMTVELVNTVEDALNVMQGMEK